MSDDPVEVRMVYEEETVIRTGLWVETIDSSECSLHRGQQQGERGTPVQASGQASSSKNSRPKDRDRAQGGEAQCGE